MRRARARQKNVIGHRAFPPGVTRATAGFRAAFLVSGIASTMLGPLMPGFEARWHMGDQRAGLLFTAQAIASVLVSFFAGPLAQRFGFSRLVAPGLLLMAAASAGTAVAHSWIAAMVCFFGIGAGLGLVIPAGNLGTSAMHGGASARQVMTLNLVWCCGALFGPFLIQMLGNRFLLALPAAIGLAAGLAMTVPEVPLPVAHHESRRDPSHVRRAAILTSLLVFFYVGAENGISGWISTFALRSGEVRELWAILPSAFWLTMLAGRSASQLLLRKLSSAQLAATGMILGLGGTVFLLASHSATAFVAAALLCGLGLAPIFPSAVAQFGPVGAGSNLAGLVFACANLGSAVIPFAIGALSAQTGTLRWGLAALVPLFVIMLLAQWRLARTIARVT